MSQQDNPASQPPADGDLAALEAAAKALAQGPWLNYSDVLYGEVIERQEAEYIAAADPAAVLRLIARVREAEARVEQLEAVLKMSHEDIMRSGGRLPNLDKEHPQ